MVKATVALLCKCTSNVKKRRADETPEKFLKQVTHLYLNEKNLTELGPEISLCRNLTVLYLYGNFLEKIPEMASANQLTHLYLQNNNIQRIENLKNLLRLEKLFLSRNCISMIEGLEGLKSLQELRIDNQRLPPEECLLFDDQSLSSVSKSLLKLDVSGNRLETLEDLGILSSLTYLCASNNRIADINELASTLKKLTHLRELEVVGNPVMTANRARENLIVSTTSLEILDGKEVSTLTRGFLEKWYQHKGKLFGSYDQPTSKSEPATVLGPETTFKEPSAEIISLKKTPGGDLNTGQGELVKQNGESKRKVLKGGKIHQNDASSEWDYEKTPHPTTEALGPSGCGESGL
ncbi:Protein phosphatase 1 regulatory subunit 42 [Fasciola gigantica]|uniref:Protein phosphatase 1 regulatory subunit 42 n=1 Tax=Fasciola gigantica TaxID=46835 RepID=A0A504YHL9_FASGI|nr:Protein phosphatase 1 regulatory subunit 42 [Fasciola gigantica]